MISFIFKRKTLWNDFEKQFSKVGVDIKYIPYTTKASSTMLREKIKPNN